MVGYVVIIVIVIVVVIIVVIVQVDEAVGEALAQRIEKMIMEMQKKEAEWELEPPEGQEVSYITGAIRAVPHQQQGIKCV